MTASAVVLLGAGWTFGSSVFSGDMSMGARDVITISHDLTNEKVIPAASERGGYQVPNLDMQVLQRSASNASFFSTTRAAPDPEQPSLLSADEVASLSVAPAASKTAEAGLETPTTVADPVVTVTNALSAQSSQSSLPVSEALAEIASVEPTVAMSDNQETQVVAQAAVQDDQPDLMVPKVDGLMTGTDNALQQPLQYGVQTPRTPGAMTAGALDTGRHPGCRSNLWVSAGGPGWVVCRSGINGHVVRSLGSRRYLPLGFATRRQLFS